MSRSRAAVAISSLALAASLSSAAPAVAAPAPAVAAGARAQAVQALPWPVLQRGSTGEPVRTLQYLLRARGYAIGVDGGFGPQTDGALRAFQRSRGLTADGTTTPRTWTALLITVRSGSTGDAVRAVQSQFQFRNQSGDPRKGVQVDGVYGPQTRSAVRGFQSAVGLSPDGIVGPRTWNQLIGGALSF
jgi:peptidoglycan hydrolase-like protein with peptidoglycan-binding domain